MAIDSGDTITFTTDKAQQNAKQEYSNLAFNTMGMFASAITTSVSGYDSHIPDMYVQFLMGMIVDTKRREELRTERKELIKQAIEYAKDDVELRDMLIFEANMDIFSKVVETFDKWIGIINKQVIMQVSKREMQCRKPQVQQ